MGTKQMVGAARNRLSTFFSKHLDGISPSSLGGPTCCSPAPRGPREASLHPERAHLITLLSPDSALSPPTPSSPPLGGPWVGRFPSSDPHAAPDKPRFSTSGSPQPRHSPSQLLKCGERAAWSRGACTCPGAVSACLPAPRRVRPGKLMALGPAGASTLQLSSEHDEVPKSTHLHEEQHVFLRSAHRPRRRDSKRLTGPSPAPVARIRDTLRLALHPAADPASPPSAAAP